MAASTAADLRRSGRGSLKAAAYHEAGHAVARIYVGAPATLTEIFSDGSGKSHGTGELWRGTGQYAAWDHALVCYAGPMAEARATHHSLVAVLLSHGAADYARVCELRTWLIDRGYVDNDRAAMERIERDTREFLRHYWPSIDRVARALLESRSLAGEQVQQVVQLNAGGHA